MAYLRLKPLEHDVVHEGQMRSTKGGHRLRYRLVRTLPLLLFVPLVLFLLPDPASPVTGPSPRTLPDSLRLELPRRAAAKDLTEAVGRGVLAPAVAHAAAGGSVEALLILAGEDALAKATAKAPATTGRTRAVLGATRAAYASQKTRLLGRLGGITVLRDYETLPIVFVRFSGAAAVLRASNDPEIVGIAENERREKTLAQSLPLIGQPSAAAGGNDGAGIGVAILDTGVDFTDPAFGSCTSPNTPAVCRVVVAEDTAPNDGQRDDDGHGTNVSAIVGGVAPGSDLLVFDVFDGNGAFDSDILQAIDSSIANQATFNVRAINLSLGTPEDFRTSPCGGGTNPYVSAFANARAVRITPVVAAGNDAAAFGGFTNGIGAPSCTPGAISVGAVYDGDNGSLDWIDCVDSTTAGDQITCFSQSASILTLLAPGALIVGAGIEQGGTSQASPHVAGAVAVLAEAAPGQSVDAITTAIANSGPSILDARNGVTKHRFDLPAAVAAILAAPSPSPSPSPSPTQGTCTIVGTGAGEVLQGTPGDDFMCGNGGDDYLVPGDGNDTVQGGAGFDFVSYENAAGSVTVNLRAGTGTGFGTDELSQIEGVVGGPFADVITGSAESNDILGFGGDDQLSGSGGFDYLRFDFSASGIEVDLAQGFSAGEGTDVVTGFEGIVGSAGADSLSGKRGTNEIFGLRGGDEIAGLGGDDDLFGQGGGDVLLGGRGNDDLIGGPGGDTCVQGAGTGIARSC